MKLLPKKAIDTEKQKERKAEIDEGIKLANSIDEMRRLRADEENNLTQYRTNALKIIQDEISAYLIERDGYAKEIIELQNQRILLLAPIEAEWKEINEARADLIEKESSFAYEQKMAREAMKERTKAFEKREETIAAIEKSLRERTLDIINKESELSHGNV